MKRPVSVAAFAAGLLARGAAPPILVIRVPALERAAWREGLRSARALERRVLRAFVEAADHVLRREDPIVHDSGSDVFLAALIDPRRDGASAAAIDARTALARLEIAVAGAADVEVRAGWAPFDRVQWEASPELALEAALERGERERERYAFFSTIGHELRTPLSAIRGYLETVIDDPTLPLETRVRFLTTAFDETLRLGRLVDGMFDISMLDLGGQTSAVSVGSLETAVACALDAVAHFARARAVVVTDAVGNGGVATGVRIGTDRLAQVVINLLDNAIKHGRRGGRVRVGIRDRDAHRVALTVDDDGPGVRAEERETIFHFANRGSSAADGSGIGLALARALVERAGGTVACSASPLGGARFEVTLPVLQ